MANCNTEDTSGYSTKTVNITDQDASVKKDDENDAVVHKEIDTHYGKKFIDKFFAIPEEDNDKFLRKIRARIDKYFTQPLIYTVIIYLVIISGQ